MAYSASDDCDDQEQCFMPERPHHMSFNHGKMSKRAEWFWKQCDSESDLRRTIFLTEQGENLALPLKYHILTMLQKHYCTMSTLWIYVWDRCVLQYENSLQGGYVIHWEKGRRVIPTCATHLITTTYPTDKTDDYKEYHSGNDEN